MTKVALFSDLHGHNWSDFSSIGTYRKTKLNDRLIDCLKVIDTLIDYCWKHKIKHVVFAGDLFHRKRLLEVTVFNPIATRMRRLAMGLDSLWVLAGNHDMARRASAGTYSQEHALEVLGKFKGITVIDQPTIIDGLGFIPYVDDHDTMKQAIDAVTNADWLVMHAGISGAKTGAIEYRPLEPLTDDQLPNVPVFSGHYHFPQSIVRQRVRGEPITYIGAPLEFVRKDGHHKKRGFVVYDTVTKDITRVPVKGPRFVELLASAPQIRNEDVRGNFIDLTLDDPQHTAQDLVDMLREHGARSINTIPYAEPTQKKARFKVDTRKGLPSIADLCDAYVKRAPEKLNRDLLRAISRQALEDES